MAILESGKKFTIVENRKFIGRYTIEVEITKVNKKTVKYKMKSTGLGESEYSKNIDKFLEQYGKYLEA